GSSVAGSVAWYALLAVAPGVPQAGGRTSGTGAAGSAPAAGSSQRDRLAAGFSHARACPDDTSYVILPDSEPGHHPTRAMSGLRKTPRRSQFLKGRVVVLAPSRTVAFFEPVAAPDGSRAVLFLDGHLGRVTAAEWPKLKTSSGIP